MITKDTMLSRKKPKVKGAYCQSYIIVCISYSILHFSLAFITQELNLRQREIKTQKGDKKFDFNKFLTDISTVNAKTHSAEYLRETVTQKLTKIKLFYPKIATT